MKVMYIDLTRKGFVEAEVWSLSIRGNILVGASMKEVVRKDETSSSLDTASKY